MTADNRRISIHHIGGRNGSRIFPILSRFERDIINVLYDADVDCLAQIEEKNKHLESELHVLPYCLADGCKTVSLNINYDPFTSSFYELNPDYKSFYLFSDDHDYMLGEAIRVMEKRQLQTVSIDHLFQREKIFLPPPDFLSIDTQGAEYEILQGAKETLKSDILAVSIEAEFHPLYKDQKLFWDSVKLLSEQGFDFVKFLEIQELSPYRGPVGLRGEGFYVSSDALFFRRIDNIDSQTDEIKRYFMLRKLAFIAIVFNQFEYGLECLRKSRDLDRRYLVSQEGGSVYPRFLRNLEQKIEKVHAVYPPAFVSKYGSFEASKLRFETITNMMKVINQRPGVINRIKQLIRRIPFLYLLLRQIKQLINKLFYKIGIFLKFIFSRYTDVEKILVEYGLKTQANVLRKNRIIQSQ